MIEAVSGTNYRRAVKDWERDGKLPVSFHTAHGWGMRSGCDEIKISPQTVVSIPIQTMPAGTGFKGSGIDGQARNVWLYGSDKKATKIARIILKRFTNANAWEDYWQTK